MKAEVAQVTTIDAYIAAAPEEVRSLLGQIRVVIREEAPDATEAIAYGLATFRLQGNLVHFGAFKKHIGFYPGASGIAQFEERLTGYVHAKGLVQFPLGSPLPLDLIREITAFRVAESRGKKAGIIFR